LPKEVVMSNKLFTPAPPNKWQRNAVVGGIFSTPYAHILGYYRAADVLVQATLEAGGHANDVLFYPICFNYRHYVELSLKHLIIYTERFYKILDEIGDTRGQLDKSVRDELEGHSLERLFNLFIERLQLLTDEKFDDNIRIIIMQLHGMDPDGQNFRYVYRLNGKLAMPSQGWYDLEIVRRRMEDVCNYLSGIDIWLQDNLDLALDFLSEYSNYHNYRRIDESSYFRGI
jgi:hypothetical protein